MLAILKTPNTASFHCVVEYVLRNLALHGRLLMQRSITYPMVRSIGNCSWYSLEGRQQMTSRLCYYFSPNERRRPHMRQAASLPRYLHPRATDVHIFSYNIEQGIYKFQEFEWFL